MTAIDILEHINKQCRPIVSGSQNFICRCFPRKVTATISFMEIFHDLLRFFFHQTIQKNATKIFPIKCRIKNAKLGSFNLSVLALFLVILGGGDKFLSTYMISEYHEREQTFQIPELMMLPHSHRT